MGKFLVLFGPKSYNGVWGKLIGVNFYKNGKQYDTQNFVHIVLHVLGGSHGPRFLYFLGLNVIMVYGFN